MTGAAVGTGVGATVGTGVGAGVGATVGAGVGATVGTGKGVAPGVGARVVAGVGETAALGAAGAFCVGFCSRPQEGTSSKIKMAHTRVTVLFFICIPHSRSVLCWMKTLYYHLWRFATGKLRFFHKIP